MSSWTCHLFTMLISVLKEQETKAELSATRGKWNDSPFWTKDVWTRSQPLCKHCCTGPLLFSGLEALLRAAAPTATDFRWGLPTSDRGRGSRLERQPISTARFKLPMSTFLFSNSHKEKKKPDGFSSGWQWLLRRCLCSFKRRQFSRCMAL